LRPFGPGSTGSAKKDSRKLRAFSAKFPLIDGCFVVSPDPALVIVYGFGNEAASFYEFTILNPQPPKSRPNPTANYDHSERHNGASKRTSHLGTNTDLT
jgi:hypothetical protein